MRVAVTGTHGVGKTTLIDDFLALRPHYEHAQEP
jgi:broad-specificity NMP kinase